MVGPFEGHRFTSVGLLLDITVGVSQWTSLFRIVRAGFRGSMLRRATFCCGDLAHLFLRLLGVVFGRVSLRTQSHFGQVCVAPNTCDSYRDHGPFRRPFGVIGNETWWFPAGFAEGYVWSKALHREETVQFWTRLTYCISRLVSVPLHRMGYGNTTSAHKTPTFPSLGGSVGCCHASVRPVRR